MALYTLEELAKYRFNEEKEIPQQVKQNSATVNLGGVASSLWYTNEGIAIYEISQNNIAAAKQRFFNCGWLDEYCVNHCNDNFLDYGIHHTCYSILSDNEEMILRYSKLRYKPWGKMKGMEENILLGKDPIWCNTIQMFMANDNAGIERNLNILETITLKKNIAKQKLLTYDYEFYKALYANDRSKMEELLEIFTSPKMHKKRNAHQLVLNQYISLPALGYAKLAWRRGIEVEVNSPLIPKELLPIKPLEKYEIPYEFLYSENINPTI